MPKYVNITNIKFTIGYKLLYYTIYDPYFWLIANETRSTFPRVYKKSATSKVLFHHYRVLRFLKTPEKQFILYYIIARAFSVWFVVFLTLVHIYIMRILRVCMYVYVITTLLHYYYTLAYIILWRLNPYATDHS